MQWCIYSWKWFTRVTEVPSGIQQLWSRMELRTALMAPNVPKCSCTCSDVQTCQGEITQIRSGFALRANGQSLVQTDLISVWFTTVNHLMSRCRHQIAHSFIFLSLGYNKSGLEKKWKENFGSRVVVFFSSPSSIFCSSLDGNGLNITKEKWQKKKEQVFCCKSPEFHICEATVGTKSKTVKRSQSCSFNSYTTFLSQRFVNRFYSPPVIGCSEAPRPHWMGTAPRDFFPPREEKIGEKATRWNWELEKSRWKRGALPDGFLGRCFGGQERQRSGQQGGRFHNNLLLQWRHGQHNPWCYYSNFEKEVSFLSFFPFWFAYTSYRGRSSKY